MFSRRDIKKCEDNVRALVREQETGHKKMAEELATSVEQVKHNTQRLKEMVTKIDSQLERIISLLQHSNET